MWKSRDTALSLISTYKEEVKKEIAHDSLKCIVSYSILDEITFQSFCKKRVPFLKEGQII